jgi:predicted nucleic acid-binding Zn ribbon protein
MPLYDYKCEACGHKFEVMQKFDDPAPPCPHKPEPEGSEEVEVAACGGPTTRLISGGNFHLKGSGWYKTDYKD